MAHAISARAMDGGLFPPEAAKPKRKVKTGGEKRLAQNALPRCVYIQTSHDKMITGAGLLMACCKTDHPEEVEWTLTRAVRLKEPVLVTKELRTYWGMVYLLKPEVDARLKMSEAAVGGVLSQHLEIGQARSREKGSRAEGLFSLTPARGPAAGVAG